MKFSDLRSDDISDFLFLEAECLDAWDLKRWLGLFAEDGRYIVPTPDLPDTASAERQLYFISDDYSRLRGRVNRLLQRTAHAEFPHSKTRHTLSNVRIRRSEPSIFTSAAFITYRHKDQATDVFVGSVQHHLVLTSDGLRIKEKKCVLDIDTLHQGMISIIL